MIEFGIPVLDKEFQGINTGIILAEGVAGCGKTVLGYHLVSKAVERGDLCIVVTSTRNPKEIKEDLAYYKLKSSSITWIRTVGDPDPSNGVITTNIGELFTVSAAIKKVVEENKGKNVVIYFDAVSSALMSNTVEQVYKFFSNVIQHLKKNTVTAFFIIEMQMHDPKDIASMEHLSDIVLEFVIKSANESAKRGFVIKKKGGRPALDKVFNFVLTEKGLEINQYNNRPFKDAPKP